MSSKPNIRLEIDPHDLWTLSPKEKEEEVHRRLKKAGFNLRRPIKESLGILTLNLVFEQTQD